MASSRGGMCLADGWNASYQTLDGDFAMDVATVDRLLVGAPGSLGRLGEETGAAVWGPGNIAANSTAALA
jgi:hypothetical protein